MQANKKTLKNKLRPLLVNFVAIAVVGFFIILFIGNDIKEIASLINRKDQLISSIEDEGLRKQRLEKEGERINSRAYIEQIAREDLNLFYPNEMVVIEMEEDPKLGIGEALKLESDKAREEIER